MKAYLVVGIVLGGLVVLAGVGAWWQAVAGRRDRRRFPPPGEMVTVGDHHLHMHLSGPATATSPTVVLEAGMASMSANWAWVQDELAQEHRVVSYDRRR